MSNFKIIIFFDFFRNEALKAMTGFSYEGDKKKKTFYKDDAAIRDKEGVDF